MIHLHARLYGASCEEYRVIAEYLTGRLRDGPEVTPTDVARYAIARSARAIKRRKVANGQSERVPGAAANGSGR